jgi:hypothetical protein
MTPDNREPHDDTVYFLLAKISLGLMVLLALFALYTAGPTIVEDVIHAWHRWGVVFG